LLLHLPLEQQSINVIVILAFVQVEVGSLEASADLLPRRGLRRRSCTRVRRYEILIVSNQRSLLKIETNEIGCYGTSRAIAQLLIAKKSPHFLAQLV
jgi:hypothetical protein